MRGRTVVPGRVSRGGPRRPRRAAGELESEVLAALWASDQALTPGEVQQALGGELAYNTVHTILVRLFDKGLVERVGAGRAHAYSPTQGADALVAERMQALLERGPDRQAVLQRFVTSLSAEDERALRTMLGRVHRG